MAMRVYYACKAIGVRAHGSYSPPGKHTCEFSVDDEDTDKFVGYMEEHDSVLEIDSANIYCYRMFKGDNIFWVGRFSRSN